MAATTAQIWRTMAFIEAAPVSPDVTVTVVTATRNRVSWLAEAIQSVLAQSHQNLELVVVDDGSSDATPEHLAARTDPRVRTLRTEGIGVAGARNRALAVARGTIIAYLDDDNLMHPHWLRSTVWAFSRWPDVDVVYGAALWEDSHPYRRVPHEMPLLRFEWHDREQLSRHNTIDINVLAHRSGLVEARFDQSLSGCADWELLLRLTHRKPPLALPVLAVAYRTSAPNRLCEDPGFWEEAAAVRRAAAERDAEPG